MKGAIVTFTLLFGLVACHPLIKLHSAKAPCSITNCGTDSKIKDLVVKFDPDPPKTGDKLTITIAGQLDESVTGGEVKVVAKLGFITVLESTYNVCDIVSGGCPIEGTFSGTASEDIRSGAPKFSYDISIKGTDQSGGELLCVDAKCTFQ